MREPIHRLVLEYLAHHGYARTARAFKAQCDRRRGLDADATSGAATGAGPARGGGADPDVEMGDESGRRGGDDLELRTRIVGAVVAGEMDAALAETRARYPGVLEEANGLMLIKMRCRKFVEMVLEAAEAQRRVRAESEDGVVLVGGEDEEEEEEEEERMVMIGVGADGMDVDDDAPMAGSSDRTGVTNGYVTVRGPGEEGSLSVSTSPGAGAEEGLLLKALAYGRALDAEYNLDGRPEVRAICERTFAILASKDLATAGGAVAEVVGHEARVALANELNQAILSAWCSRLLSGSFCPDGWFVLAQSLRDGLNGLRWRCCTDRRRRASSSLGCRALARQRSQTCPRSFSMLDPRLLFWASVCITPHGLIPLLPLLYRSPKPQLILNDHYFVSTERCK